MLLKEQLLQIEKLNCSVNADLNKVKEEQLMKQRLKLFEKGKMKFDSWEHFKNRLLKKFS